MKNKQTNIQKQHSAWTHALWTIASELQPVQSTILKDVTNFNVLILGQNYTRLRALQN